jgi:hypothetical protein
MRSLTIAALVLLIATAGCRRHPTYGVTPGPVVPTDTLNGEPNSHAPPKVPDQPVRGERNSPPPPP